MRVSRVDEHKFRIYDDGTASAESNCVSYCLLDCGYDRLLRARSLRSFHFQPAAQAWLTETFDPAASAPLSRSAASLKLWRNDHSHRTPHLQADLGMQSQVGTVSAALCIVLVPCLSCFLRIPGPPCVHCIGTS